MTDEAQAITQPENRYFHIMLNMADDELDPYEYRLLGHYVRVGTTFESTRTTAQKTKMSVGKVASTRQALVIKGYIEITKAEGQETLSITILDRMLENVSRFDERSSGEQSVHQVNKKGRKRSSGEQERSSGEPKKINDKKELDSKKELSEEERVRFIVTQMMFLASPEDETIITKAQHIMGANLAKSLNEFQPAVTESELKLIWAEWRKAHKNGFTMPWNHSDFHAYIQRYRRLEAQKPKPVSLSDADAEIFSSPEDKDEVIRLFNQALTRGQNVT